MNKSTGQQVAYRRVSTTDQNTNRQLDGMTFDREFSDKASGKDTKRPGLTEALAYVRQGDTLHVHSMDRLARNLVDLLGLVKGLTGRGVAVKFHHEQLTFTGEANPMQELQLAVMGGVAQFERSMIKERQREGIDAYKARGGTFGPKGKLTDEQRQEIVRRAVDGEEKTKLAKEFGVSRAMVYKLIGQEA
jgi:DNA invertase Pin-like site-specific DNA recombinase